MCPPCAQFYRRCSARCRLWRIEQAEVDRLAHLEVAERRWMNPVAAIVCRIEQVRIARAAHDLVEIEHPIKASARANPVVDLVSDLGFHLAPTGIPRLRGPIVPGDDGRTDDFDTFGS